MKKLAIILVVIIMCFAFTACKDESEPTTTAETSVVHTLPPTEVVTDEYEWAEVDCDITIFDENGNAIVYPESFETFAVVGSTDEDSYIKLKVTDEAKDVLSAIDSKENLALMINGDTYGDVTYCGEPFNGEIEIGHSFAYEQICNIATVIRGLFN